jgi:hypothetical protein
VEQPPPQRPWGQRPPPPQPQQPPQRPWGYRPPPAPPRPPRPPGAPPPWYRHPVGLLLIGAVVVIVLALVVPAFTADTPEPAPTVTTADFGVPGTTAPGATTTSAGQPATAADRLAQTAQGELREAGEVTSVTAPPGGPVTVTWEITQAGSQGLTRNNARFGVMRIMRAFQQSELAAGRYREVRLLGRFQLPGQAAPTTVLRLRLSRATVQRTEFDDRRYLEAFELADSATVHPAFRG